MFRRSFDVFLIAFDFQRLVVFRDFLISDAIFYFLFFLEIYDCICHWKMLQSLKIRCSFLFFQDTENGCLHCKFLFEDMLLFVILVTLPDKFFVGIILARKSITITCFWKISWSSTSVEDEVLFLWLFLCFVNWFTIVSFISFLTDCSTFFVLFPCSLCSRPVEEEVSYFWFWAKWFHGFSMHL